MIEEEIRNLTGGEVLVLSEVQVRALARTGNDQYHEVFLPPPSGEDWRYYFDGTREIPEGSGNVFYNVVHYTPMAELGDFYVTKEALQEFIIVDEKLPYTTRHDRS